MFRLFISVLVLLLLSWRPSYAQGEAAVPFVLIHPGPNVNAMAGAFTALPSADPFAPFFNPAQLGHFSGEHTFAIQFYPQKADWLPEFDYSEVTFQSTAAAVGYPLDHIFPMMPLTLGFGYIDTKLDLGENVWTDAEGNPIGTFHSWEQYKAFSLGIGFNRFIRFNAGYTYKDIQSKLGPSSNNLEDAAASDFGLQLTLPLVELYTMLQEGNNAFTPVDGSEPFLDFSMGYSLANKGDKIKYQNVTTKGALPKEARMGYALSFGLKRSYHGFNLRFIQFDWSNEARDLLVNRTADNENEYINVPGKIGIWDNVILGKSNNEVTIYQGWRIQLLQTFQYSQGRFKGPGYPTFQRTHGFLFSSRGVFKWLSAQLHSGILDFAAEHINLQYMETRYTTQSPLNDTYFEGLGISLSLL